MEPITNLERLREVALDQHGFVTTAQASVAGVDPANLPMMVRRGRLERVAHGVYRVPQVAETEFDEYQLAVLWASVPEACLSHETALHAWGISDVNPDRIHVTIARGRRLTRAGGRGYVIHHEDLDESQVDRWQGIRTVDVPTAISQSIASGVPSYLIRQAIDRAGKTSRLPVGERNRLTEELELRDARG